MLEYIGWPFKKNKCMCVQSKLGSWVFKVVVFLFFFLFLKVPLTYLYVLLNFLCFSPMSANELIWRDYSEFTVLGGGREGVLLHGLFLSSYGILTFTEIIL